MVPIRPIFCKQYVDDTYNRRQKNTVDKLYDGLKNYHPKIKLTIETNPLRFLVAEIIHNNGMIETRVHRKKRKLPTPWTSNIYKIYKQNTIKAELYRANHISSNNINEVTLIKNKLKSANYPMRFVNSITHEFTIAQTSKDNEFTIPPWLLEVRKKIVLLENLIV